VYTRSQADTGKAVHRLLVEMMAIASGDKNGSPLRAKLAQRIAKAAVANFMATMADVPNDKTIVYSPSGEAVVRETV